MFILPEELNCKLYRVFSWLRGSNHRPISCVISRNPETLGLYTDVGALPLLTELLPRTVLLNEASEGTLQRIAALLAGEAQDHPGDNFEYSKSTALSYNVPWIMKLEDLLHPWLLLDAVASFSMSLSILDRPTTSFLMIGPVIISRTSSLSSSLSRQLS